MELQNDGSLSQAIRFVDCADHGLITGIRQRVMAYIYLHSCREKNKAEALRRFFYHFEDYSNLAIWKVGCVFEF